MYAVGNNSFLQEMTMTHTTMRAAGAVLALAALLGGCQKSDPGEAGPAERAGRKLDQASDLAGRQLTDAAQQANEKITDAAKDTSQKIDQATGAASDKLNEATEAAGKKLEQAGEKMQAKAKEREASGK
jgi:gas vesicle protein